jgi:hypothetical protein
MLLEAFKTLSPVLIHKVLGYYVDHQAEVDAPVAANDAGRER